MQICNPEKWGVVTEKSRKIPEKCPKLPKFHLILEASLAEHAQYRGGTRRDPAKPDFHPPLGRGGQTPKNALFEAKFVNFGTPIFTPHFSMSGIT